jgi:hypothetical protein
MLHENTAFAVLSTDRFPWSNGARGCHHKHMVDSKPVPLTPKQRLDLVRKLTKCQNKSAFARWIGAKTAQAVQQWEKREVTREGALMIKRATGAATDFLLTGMGEPFPNGVTVYRGADAGGLAQRIDTVETISEQVGTVLSQILRAVSAKLPDVGRDVVQQLEAEIAASVGANSQVLAAAIAAARSGLAEATPEPRSRTR